MKTLLWYGLIPLVFGSLSVIWHPRSATWNPPQPGEDEVRVEDLVDGQAELLWVDARGKDAYDRAHVPDALWLSEDDFDAGLLMLLERWQPGVRIVVYCDSQVCDASHAVARRLREEVGLPDVWVLFGGWDAWQRFN